MDDLCSRFRCSEYRADLEIQKKTLQSPQSAESSTMIGASFLHFFGKCSYGLYVLHRLLMPRLENWFPASEA